MEMPRKCFVSYSYDDIEAHQALIEALPKHIKPHSFPEIKVAPDELVSNRLIDAILKQDALIYLEGGFSAKSFWVAFERDFALRAGKKVYAFDPMKNELSPIFAQPMRLPFFVSCSSTDIDKMTTIVNLMRDKRYFDAFSLNDLPPRKTRRHREAAETLTREAIVEKLNRGGYMVVFWSKNSSKSKRVNEEIQFGLEFGRYFTSDETNLNFSRLLYALLDDTELPIEVQNLMKNEANFMIKPVQLYGDDELSAINRIDDLIVRLYWLIYRNTQQIGS